MNTPGPEFRGDHVFHGAAALVFGVSAAATIVWCGSMSRMPGMSMPGGWTMSMAWMRMPGQAWSGAAGTFIGMWCLMMLAMMLPVLVPTLAQYRRSLRRRALPLALRTTTLAAAYFGVWALAGLALYPLGMAWAELTMRSTVLASAVPALTGLTLLMAGLLQWSRWKREQLRCCESRSFARPDDTGVAGAWRLGVRLGLRCNYCCANFTAVLLALGVMDLRAMAAVMLAIAAERLLPLGALAARVSGVVLILGGGGLLIHSLFTA